MAQDRGPLYEVAWQEVFPWLRLARGVGLAVDLRKLFLAAVGIALTAAGWSLLAAMFPSADVYAVRSPAASIEWPWRSTSLLPPPFGDSALIAVRSNAAWFGEPLRQLARDPWSLPGTTRAFLAVLWGLGVWAFLGLAISRIAAVELALEERVGLKSALRYAWSKWRSCFAAPLMPLGTILAIAAPLYVLGRFMGWLDAGWLVAGLLWPLVLVAGVLMAILLVGLALGWPLMWATLAVEAGDSFDALHGPYSYVFQRPIQYAFYVLICGVLGLAAWWVASLFGGVVLSSIQWATGIGFGMSLPQRGVGWFGASLVLFWEAAIPLTVLAYGISYFWTAWTGIYYQLRRDTDATDLDEVYVDQPEANDDLPPLTPDAAGVPTLAESASNKSSESAQ